MASPSPPLPPLSSTPSPVPPPSLVVQHQLQQQQRSRQSPQPSVVSSGSGGSRLRDLPQVSSNEAIKAYASISVRLSELTTEFLQKLSTAQKAHSQQLSSLCTVFRRKAQDIQKNWVHCDGTHFSVWNALITSTEDDAKAYQDLSSSVLDSISQDLQTHTARNKLLFKKMFQYRASMTARVEKTEQDLQKSHKEYCEQWNKYGESFEKDQVKDNQILMSYNHHNNYVLHKASFNSLHDVFYREHVYAMLDEIQSIHKELLDGYAYNIARFVELSQNKLDFTQSKLRHLANVVSDVNSVTDIEMFVTKNASSVVYPPPKPVFQLPESSHPNLPILSDNLQLIDLTQAPLLHLLDDLRKQEQVCNGQREKLQTEYDSEIGLYESYRSNPSLGDAHDVKVEMIHMRHVIREKECERSEIAGKLSMFTELEEGGLSMGLLQPQVSLGQAETAEASVNLPRRSSEIFIQGKEHEWTDFNKKFPVQCRYCNGFIQVPVRPGSVCKVCRICVHSKCQLLVPYCSGDSPTPKSPKLSRANLKRVYKKMKGGGSASFNTTTGPIKEDTESSGGEIPEAGGIYCTIEDRFPGAQPNPPPREQSLDPKRRSNYRESLFEPSGEWDAPTHCVALYDYEKFNPNDMPLVSGDVIELLNTASTDWWKGTVGDSKGYFPAQYVQVVCPGDVIYRALYDYTASASSEMSLSEGQVLVLTHDEGDGWVSTRSGEKEGLVPKNYLVKLTEV